ncbi:phospholipase D-like domain-containing protein [Massilia frigida]|nr:phospholipase D-like domain-containing protein [Massilia frigida]
MHIVNLFCVKTLNLCNIKPSRPAPLHSAKGGANVPEEQIHAILLLQYLLRPSWRYALFYPQKNAMKKFHRRIIGFGFAIGCVATSPALAERVQLSGESSGADVLFSTQDDIALYLVDFINKAQRRVWVSANEFTLPEVAQAIIQAKVRGLDVRVLLDASQTGPDKNNAAARFRAGGITPLVHSRNRGMHQNFVICDDDRVAFGSAGFTAAAMQKARPGTPSKKTADNFNLFVGVPALAKQYVAEFERLSLESAR